MLIRLVFEVLVPNDGKRLPMMKSLSGRPPPHRYSSFLQHFLQLLVRFRHWFFECLRCAAQRSEAKHLKHVHTLHLQPIGRWRASLFNRAGGASSSSSYSLRVHIIQTCTKAKHVDYASCQLNQSTSGGVSRTLLSSSHATFGRNRQRRRKTIKLYTNIQ